MAEPPARSAVTIHGRHRPVAAARIEGAVRLVLARERRRADISVSFIGPQAIRRLNAAWKGHDRPTDVLAFGLTQLDGTLAGDIYVCRAVAAQEAEARRIPVREELLRLVIHGTLHVLGWDHPEGDGRTRSRMWKRQERYLACLS